VLVDIDVWSGDLYAGTLPQICVFTGQPTPGVHSVRYSSTPRWTIALLFAGILPYLIGLGLLRRTVTGKLPMCPAALRRFVVQRVASIAIVVVAPIACVVTGGVLLSSSGTDAGGWLVVAGVVLAVGGFVACSLWAGLITIAGSVDDRPGWGRWVQLRGVNPTFAAAVRRLYASRMPQWQIGTVPASFVGYPLPAGYGPPPSPAGWAPPGAAPPPNAGPSAARSMDY
jgi:hypothetical protein